MAVKAALCAIAQNEAPDIAEWVLHHLCLGFSNVIVYDNESDDGTSAVLEGLARHLPVIRIHWPAANWENPQCAAYEHCAQLCRGKIDWMAAIDTDEFLVNLFDEPISAFLERMAAHNHIAINWLMFGSSGIADSAGRLVLETFLERAPLGFGPNAHVKSIIRPEAVQACANAHTFVTQCPIVDSYGRPLRHWDQPGLVAADAVVHGDWRLHHYFTRSHAHWDKRRRRRGNATINPDRSDREFRAYDRCEVRDDAALRYVPVLRAAMHRLQLADAAGSATPAAELARR